MAEEAAALTVLHQPLTPLSTHITYNSISPTGENATLKCYRHGWGIGKHHCNPAKLLESNACACLGQDIAALLACNVCLFLLHIYYRTSIVVMLI